MGQFGLLGRLSLPFEIPFPGVTAGLARRPFRVARGEHEVDDSYGVSTQTRSRSELDRFAMSALAPKADVHWPHWHVR